jgi:hypothetical protein
LKELNVIKEKLDKYNEGLTALYNEARTIILRKPDQFGVKAERFAAAFFDWYDKKGINSLIAKQLYMHMARMLVMDLEKFCISCSLTPIMKEGSCLPDAVYDLGDYAYIIGDQAREPTYISKRGKIYQIHNFGQFFVTRHLAKRNNIFFVRSIPDDKTDQPN